MSFQASKEITQLASFKRRGPVDIIFYVGLALIIIGVIATFCLHATGFVWMGIVLFSLGIAVVIYGIIIYQWFRKNATDALLPTEVQVQNRIISTLLSDNVSEQNKAQILTNLSRGIGMSKPKDGDA